MRWQCQRGCAAGGAKVYPSPAAARRYAAVLDKQDNDDIGRRAPILAMFPLRIWHAIHRRSQPH